MSGDLKIFLLLIALPQLVVAAVGVWFLARAVRKARLEARQQTDFTAGVSHEFKTPITAIQLAAEYAERHTTREEVRRALKDVQEEAQRLSHLVSDVLDVGRLSGGLRLETEPVEVGAGVWARANAAALRHIRENLEDNARKYAPGQPVEWRARTKGKKVFLDALDRGPGMSRNEMKHVFERYWRADRTVIRNKGGCGLGLAIARQLARAMGGDLTVAARQGGGSIFTLRLKRAEQKQS